MGVRVEGLCYLVTVIKVFKKGTEGEDVHMYTRTHAGTHKHTHFDLFL